MVLRVKLVDGQPVAFGWTASGPRVVVSTETSQRSRSAPRQVRDDDLAAAAHVEGVGHEQQPLRVATVASCRHGMIRRHWT